MRISGPGQKLVKQYLNKIEKHLRSSGCVKEEIEAVLMGTEEQILDQLVEKDTSDQQAIQSVIDTMDAPESYMQFSDYEETEDRIPDLAKLGLISGIVGPFAALLTGMLAAVLGGEGSEVGSLVFFVFEVTALILGGLQFKRSMGKSALVISVLFIAFYFSLAFWSNN
jgi:hypothetical protein